jgi:hypothetical protein
MLHDINATIASCKSSRDVYLLYPEVKERLSQSSYNSEAKVVLFKCYLSAYNKFSQSDEEKWVLSKDAIASLEKLISFGTNEAKCNQSLDKSQSVADMIEEYIAENPTRESIGISELAAYCGEIEGNLYPSLEALARLGKIRIIKQPKIGKPTTIFIKLVSQVNQEINAIIDKIHELTGKLNAEQLAELGIAFADADFPLAFQASLAHKFAQTLDASVLLELVKTHVFKSSNETNAFAQALQEIISCDDIDGMVNKIIKFFKSATRKQREVLVSDLVDGVGVELFLTFISDKTIIDYIASRYRLDIQDMQYLITRLLSSLPEETKVIIIQNIFQEYVGNPKVSECPHTKIFLDLIDAYETSSKKFDYLAKRIALMPDDYKAKVNEKVKKQAYCLIQKAIETDNW